MKKNVDKELCNLPLMDIKKTRRKVVSIKRNIESDYKNELTSIERKYRERSVRLNEYLKELNYYSTFKLSIIGSYIADLFTLYKGEEYNYDFEWKSYPNSLPTMKCFVQSNANRRKKVYFEWKDFEAEKNIIFYHLLPGEDTIFEHYLFKYYPFVREFIDFVIKYRMENKVSLGLVNDHLMEKLLRDYVILHKTEIEEVQNTVLAENKSAYDATLQLVLAKPYLDRKNETQKV